VEALDVFREALVLRRLVHCVRAFGKAKMKQATLPHPSEDGLLHREHVAALRLGVRLQVEEEVTQVDGLLLDIEEEDAIECQGVAHVE